MGLRKSRYKGTNRGTKGTILNQSLLRLLLVPQFPQKKYDFGDVHVPRFPYWKKLKNRGTNCVNSNSKDTLSFLILSSFFLRLRQHRTHVHFLYVLKFCAKLAKLQIFKKNQHEIEF